MSDLGAHQRCVFAASVVILCAGCVASAGAQRARPAGRWDVSLGGEVSTPTGWVQVRESQIAGTRLYIRPDLGVSRAYTIALGVGYNLTAASALRLTLESESLNGRTVLPHDVRFNGTTLAGGTMLDTRTDFPYFVRATIAVERNLFATGRDGRLLLRAGLTFTMLTFRMHGSIASGSVGHETQEDFVTQELPVPLVGLEMDHPVTRHLHFRSALDGAYLPWINSLRHEGGEVELAQRHLDFTAAIDYALTPDIRVQVAYRYTYFVQRERSQEDGNDVQLEEPGIRLDLTHRF